MLKALQRVWKERMPLQSVFEQRFERVVRGAELGADEELVGAAPVLDEWYVAEPGARVSLTRKRDPLFPHHDAHLRRARDVQAEGNLTARKRLLTQ